MNVFTEEKDLKCNFPEDCKDCKNPCNIKGALIILLGEEVKNNG